MRPVTIVALLAVTTLLGSKCKGPKGPKAQAIDAVEQAWWFGDVEAALSDADEATVTLERFEGPPVEVHFRRDGTGSEATLMVPAAGRFHCWLDDAGEAYECTGLPSLGNRRSASPPSTRARPREL